jgi:ubiquinone/menaquinone biosynthesis C-methylase UbiE
MDATDLTFNDNSFDLTTLLEVLEHIPSAEQAVAESVRVSRRFVIVSVPSKPDDNPQHIHLLDEATLRRWFAAAGVERVNFDYAPGHLMAVAKVAG